MRSSSFREPNCVFFGAVCGEGRSSARPPELGAGLSDRSSAHREAGGGGGEAAQCPQLPGGHVAPPPPSGAPRCVARLWRHRRAPRRAVMTSPKAGRGSGGAEAAGFAPRSEDAAALPWPTPRPAVTAPCSGTPAALSPALGPRFSHPRAPQPLPRRAPTRSRCPVSMSRLVYPGRRIRFPLCNLTLALGDRIRSPEGG